MSGVHRRQSLISSRALQQRYTIQLKLAVKQPAIRQLTASALRLKVAVVVAALRNCYFPVYYREPTQLHPWQSFISLEFLLNYIVKVFIFMMRKFLAEHTV